MEDAPYKDVSTYVLELLRGQYGDYFNAYFDGDPEEIGISMLPALCVVAGSSRIRQGATGQDRVQQELIIKIILNKMDDFGAPETADLTEKKLRNLVLARAADGTWDTSAMAYYLRTQLSMNNTVVGNDIDIDPVTALRPTDQGRGVPMVTSELHISILTEQIVNVFARN